MKAKTFRTHEIQSILDGRKTRFSELPKTQPWGHHWSSLPGYKRYITRLDTAKGIVFQVHDSVPDKHCNEMNRTLWPIYQPGQILYIREAWDVRYLPAPPEGDWDETLYYYKATEKEFTDMSWQSPATMPREAARIFLEVTDVRVERVQELDSEDAFNEGMSPDLYRSFGYSCGEESLEGFNNNYARHCYTKYWESIHGLGSWEANPWIFAYTFKQIEKPAPI